jgi:SAM-dependent methyltransferase
MDKLESWVEILLADPVTKQRTAPASFPTCLGMLDARVLLKNTHGAVAWSDGQQEYEALAANDHSSEEDYRAEIEYDRPVYEHFPMKGRILDCGGGSGTVREFLPLDVEFVSVDPWPAAPLANSAARCKAYSCLRRHVNFICAAAEFLPFVAEAFDWVHMRSMLDHVQVPDLALIEAKRVLKPGGQILVGLYVEGGKTGTISTTKRMKTFAKGLLSRLGLRRYEDHHVWHPTYAGLLKVICDSGFLVEDTYWQPHWNETVCYVRARRPSQ